MLMRRVRIGFAFGLLAFVLLLAIRLPAKFALMIGLIAGIIVGFAAKIR
jgi:hypothetical protein